MSASTSRGALLVALLLAVCGCSPDASSSPRPVARTTPTTASATPLALPDAGPGDEAAAVPLEPGTYLVPRSDWAVADFTVTFPAGWTVQDGQIFAQHTGADDEFGFHAVLVDEIFADACQGEGGRTTAVGPGVDGLVTALLDQTGGARTTRPVLTTLGSYPATRIDLWIPERLDLGTCQLAEYGWSGLQVWYSERSDGYLALVPGVVAQVYVVNVAGKRQVFVAQMGNPRSVGDRAELRTVLESISIEG